MTEVWRHPTAAQLRSSELVQNEIVAVKNSLFTKA